MKEEIRRRIEGLRGKLAERRLGGLLITDTANVRYMSGFTGADSALLITDRRLKLLTDFRYVEEAQQSAPLYEVASRKGSLYELAVKVAGRCRVRRLGFEAAAVSHASARDLVKKLKSARAIPCQGLVESLREVKSDWEIERIEQALRIQEKAFRKWARGLRPGMTERDIAMDLHYAIVRRCGAEDISFPIIVAEGANASLPHAKPGTRVLREDSLVLVDFGACAEGYHSDLTRTFFLGSIPRKLRAIHEIVAEAQRRAIEAIRPGAPFADVDRAARDYIAKRKYGPAFGHSTGHGIGLRVHEAPTLSAKAKGELKAGMVVTTEPGIYIPGSGGVRIEDDVLVTADGHRVLSRLPRGLRALTESE